MSTAFPTFDETTESAVLRRVKEGGAERERAFEQIFVHFRGRVLAVCLHLTGQKSDAEDALQEVFLAVHRALPQFRGEARLSTWMYRIAVRTALSVRARRRPVEPLSPELAVTSHENDLVARSEARRLAVAMDQLSAEHRTVLSLFALDGLSHQEIADILGVPEGTVWSRLSAARRKLVAAMGPR